jgi:phosphopantothenoylcysteine synthetase/decarboxylase
VKILITSGGTEEPIDGVRYITNFSTGRTGALMAERLVENGVQVTLLHGHRAILPATEMPLDSFLSFSDLNEKLQFHLGSGEYDAVIHLAAVSDFSVEFIETEKGEKLTPKNCGKLSSDNSLNLHLKRNFKILDRLKKYNKSGKELIVTGFKLTDTDSAEERDEAVKKLLKSGKVDFVVQNNLRDITQEKHPAKIYNANGELLYKTETKKEMADRLFSLIKDILGDT